ncbi:MAG: HEAT repeat domain-containing protein [Gemmatimonadota bacterium]|nr:HEAT repeat domain-containing protein [Gemmatimonadota bacterium]
MDESETDNPAWDARVLLDQLDEAAPLAAHEQALRRVAASAVDRLARGEEDVVVDAAHAVLVRERAIGDPALRGAYAKAMDALLSPELVATIAARLASDPERYHVHVDLLDRAGEAGAAAVVSRMGDAPTIAERRLYFDLLHVLEAAVPALLRMLGDPRWYAVRNAAELLGLMEIAEAELALNALLTHEDERVRRTVAVALAKIGTPAAQQGVRQALGEASSVVRDRATTALIDGEHDSVTPLIEALEREEDEAMRKSIYMALGRVGTRPAVERLLRAARGETGSSGGQISLRVAAVQALGEAGTPMAIAALRSLLHDREEQVRGAALWAISGNAE